MVLGGFGFGGETLNELEQPEGTPAWRIWFWGETLPRAGGETLPGAGGETLLGGTPAWRIWFWGETLNRTTRRHPYLEDLVLGARPCHEQGAKPCPEQGAIPCSEAPLLGGFGFGGETLIGTTRRHPCLEDLGLSLTHRFLL